MSATNLLRIILLTSLIVMPTPLSHRLARPPACQGAQWRTADTEGLAAAPVVEALRAGWHPRLLPTGRPRQRRNPRANRQRWLRRQREWQRRRPLMRSRQRRARQPATGCALSGWPPVVRPTPSHANPPPAPVDAPPAPPPPTAPPVDPLADLRQGRGWIDCVPEAELWERFRRVRWGGRAALPALRRDGPDLPGGA